MELGDLFQYNREVLEVCCNEEHPCRCCYGRGKQRTCHKLPDCVTTKHYFRRLTPSEVRKAKREKRTIHALKD